MQSFYHCDGREEQTHHRYVQGRYVRVGEGCAYRRVEKKKKKVWLKRRFIFCTVPVVKNPQVFVVSFETCGCARVLSRFVLYDETREK